MSEREDIRSFVQQLPKAELHLHHEGSIPPDEAERLAKKAGVSLPCEIIRDEAGSGIQYRISDFMQDFLPLYIAISSCLNDVKDFSSAIAGLAKKLAYHKVWYAEVTFTPMTHVKRGVNGELLLQALREGRARAFEEHGVRINWVFDIVRIFPDQAEKTLALALAGQKDGVVALGLGGPEKGSAQPFRPFFEQGKAEGLMSAPHAGEQAGAENVWEAIDLLQADRVGHGFRSIDDPRLMQTLKERGIPLEICASSNVGLGLVESFEKHPLPELIKAGVPLSLASDDPPFFGSSINDEYCKVSEFFGFSRNTLACLAKQSFQQSFAGTDEKERLLQEQERVIKNLAN